MEPNNPVLAELDGLSPQAKNALTLAHTRATGTLASSLAPMGDPPAPAAPVAAAPAPRPIAPRFPNPAPTLGPPSVDADPATGVSALPSSVLGPGPSAPKYSDPSAQAHVNDLARLTAPGTPGEHDRTQTGLSGIGQIHNPWARIPLQIADAFGTGFFPNVMRNVPGTELHHHELVNERARDVADDTAREASDVKNTLDEAQTEEARSRAYSLEHPQEKITAVPTSTGIFGVGDKSGAVTPLTGSDGKQLQPPDKFHAPHFEKMTDGSVVAISTDPHTGEDTASVVYKGDPKVETEVAKLEVNGKSHSVIVNKATGETIKDLGQTGEKTPTINVNAGTAALDREGTHFGKPWENARVAASAQLDKIAEARAMVNGNAESQALGVPKVMTALVSGAGSGVRITQAELNAIAHARGIQGDFEGWWSKISGKGSLTNTQKGELTKILDDVQTRILEKQQIANETLDTINGARSREEIITADTAARKRLGDFERGDSRPAAGGGNDMITVQIPGQKPGPIHASQKDAFMKRYPNATVLPNAK